MKKIPLTQGKVTFVDDEDFERVNQFKWYAIKLVRKRGITFYAARHLSVTDSRNRKLLRLHRFIFNAQDSDPEIDHKDCDGLNNQKGNLRFATDAQNKGNERKRTSCSSKYKGVWRNKAAKKWQVAIGRKNRKHLGFFDDEAEAGRAYDAAAKQFFGEFARLNFPNE